MKQARSMRRSQRASEIRIKRVYDAPDPGDGARVLVDRLWPRGMRKEAAALTAWLREVAPSDELRRWFGHEPGRWEEFRRRYAEELKEKEQEIERLRQLAESGPLTLLYAARDTEHNEAVVLREALLRRKRSVRKQAR